MLDLKTADINNLSKEDKEALYIACGAFKAYKWFDIFFNHILNSYVDTTLWLNKMRHDQWIIHISDERFSGWVEMINFIKAQLIEYSQAKAMSQTK
jgi:hypothetical protein